MTSFEQSMKDRADRSTRNHQTFLEDRVTAITDVDGRKIYTIGGRTMPMLDTGEAISIGDLVIWANQVDPIAFGPVRT